uniref:Uncharacterized protein n=1 Tax=Timema tahoe TaxID=61484 RepID=A0A7R9IIZ4_9NEOP|nr:unnamed protein product [Timema tahoe]
MSLQLRLLSSSMVLRSGFRSVSTTVSKLDKPVTVKEPADVGDNSSANLDNNDSPYPLSTASVDNNDSPHATLDQALNKARVKVCLYMMAATLLGCLVYVYSGKQAAKRGDTLAKITIDHHNLLREEAKKQREAAVQQQAIK